MANLPPGAALWRAKQVAGAWTNGEHLLAGVVDLLAGANWQRTKDGSEGRNKPKPLARPGEDAKKVDTITSRAAAFRARQLAKED